MLALVVSLLLALYVLGPELLSRWFMSWVVPRKYVVYSKSEEAARAFVWCIVPFACSYWLCRHLGWISDGRELKAVEEVYAGLFSDQIFASSPKAFFDALREFIRINKDLLTGLYTIVILVSLSFNLAIRHYGRWRYRLRKYPLLKKLLAVIVLPRVAEWHVLLSNMLVMDRDLQVSLDVLTKGGILYRGKLVDRILSHDGSLISITLETPERFKRQQYIEARTNDDKVARDLFWKKIDGRMFVIMESDISSINIRHSYASVNPWKNLEDMGQALGQLRVKLNKLRRTS